MAAEAVFNTGKGAFAKVMKSGICAERLGSARLGSYMTHK